MTHGVFQDIATLGRHFIGRRVIYTHRTGGGTVHGIDPRPASEIFFGSGKGKRSVFEYLSKKDFFMKNPQRFGSTLPIFNIPNKVLLAYRPLSLVMKRFNFCPSVFVCIFSFVLSDWALGPVSDGNLFSYVG